MPQIMMRNASHFDFVGRSVDRLLRFTYAKDLFRWRFLCPLFAHPSKENARVGDHRHTPHSPILRSSFGIATNDDFASLEIKIAPFNLSSFAFAASCERQSAQQVGTIARAP